jgi:hypothetical protein
MRQHSRGERLGLAMLVAVSRVGCLERTEAVFGEHGVLL